MTDSPKEPDGAISLSTLGPSPEGNLRAHQLRAMAQSVFDAIDITESTRVDYKVRIQLFLYSIGKDGLFNGSFLLFKRTLQSRSDITVATKNKYLATARVFLRELHRRGCLPVDITAGVKSFRQSKRHKRTGITDDEMHRITDWAGDLAQTPENARLKAILALLGLQGLRQIEICRLDVQDLDLARHTALVQGKGCDDKEPIALHPQTVRLLADHLKLNRLADGPLFPGYSNNSRRLTTRGLRLIVQAALGQIGIDKTVHGFRHYFTTRLVRAYKGDLLIIAQYTRHRSLEMLQVYNDNVSREIDLPRFHRAFRGVDFDPKESSASDNPNYRK